ncbi:MAG TPA: hypothetical protein DDW76_27570 [Cyanobacteria bacterium UBA11369]|nr:hypothetical protein [Cyanobacteria bacterium UBA11371]HBE31241.1 hypothetical protein [Cyanobacteria bacterium UBA11368]HBE52427.1 hypothetical protein [Cyanobacteria bacterium UBA11369]
MRLSILTGMIFVSLITPAKSDFFPPWQGGAWGGSTLLTQTAGRLTTVTIYTANPQCQSLMPQRVRVPADQPINAAVGQVIMRVRIPGFKLAGYSVNFKRASGELTVDFRRAANSKRFVSFSSCEQLILFGSLRQTLTRNTQWRVKTVRFTELGREIRL